MVNHEPGRGTEIVEHYLDQLFASDALQLTSMSLEFVKPRIMPRIQPVSIFSHLSREQVAHVPWVNDTVIVFVTDLPHMTVSITTEQLLRWKLDLDEIEQIARQNLDEYAPELEVQLVESKEGGKAAIISQHDGYDAARLLSGLYERLAPRTRRRLLRRHAGARHVRRLLTLARVVRLLHDRVEHDYRRLPYPITPRFLLRHPRRRLRHQARARAKRREEEVVEWPSD